MVPKVNGRKLKPENFELIKNNKSGKAVYAKIYSTKSGKAKCRISLGSPKNTIPIEDLVDENFQGSCIIKLYHAYLGSTRSITLSVEEIFVKEMNRWNLTSTIQAASQKTTMSNESYRIHYRLACVAIMDRYGTFLNEIYIVVRKITIYIVDGYIN